MALKEVLGHVHHRTQSMGVGERLQLGQGGRMLGYVREAVRLKEQLWC